MNNAKTIDVYGQLILIIAWGVVAALPTTREAAFVGYFVVGAWQFMSAIIHFDVSGKQLLHRCRRQYNIILAILVAVIPVLLLIKSITLFYFYILLCISPFMAVWYLYFSYQELKTWESRAFIQMK